MDGFVLEAELTLPPSGTCRGIMGMGVDCTGRTLATGFSSPFSVGCLEEKTNTSQRVGQKLFSPKAVEPLQIPHSTLLVAAERSIRSIQKKTRSRSETESQRKR